MKKVGIWRAKYVYIRMKPILTRYIQPATINLISRVLEKGLLKTAIIQNLHYLKTKFFTKAYSVCVLSMVVVRLKLCCYLIQSL